MSPPLPAHLAAFITDGAVIPVMVMWLQDVVYIPLNMPRSQSKNGAAFFS